MDFETAARERIPIITIVLNMAKAFGGYGERITEPSEIIPAIKRAIRKTEEGTPALLEFITAKEIEYSIYK